jgi:hypothetical protein
MAMRTSGLTPSELAHGSVLGVHCLAVNTVVTDGPMK